MDIDDRRKRETEALIDAIWGPDSTARSRPPIDPAARERQNRALAAAMKAYLQQYLMDQDLANQGLAERRPQ